MDSKLDKLKKEAKRLNIELDANETIDIAAHNHDMSDMVKKGDSHDCKGGDGPYILDKDQSPPRRKPVKNINFTRRIDREAKKNG
jgi:hypothetical protein